MVVLTYCVDAEMLSQLNFIEDDASMSTRDVHVSSLGSKGIENCTIESESTLETASIALQTRPAWQYKNFLLTEMLVQLGTTHPQKYTLQNPFFLIQHPRC